MKINNWKENVSVLSLSDYRKIYSAWSAEFERGELSSKIHNLVIPITRVYLNHAESDTLLPQKNNEWKYSVEMDNWGTSEFANVKNLLTELYEYGVPNYSNEMRVWESEKNFLAFVKMCCVLRSRALLAHSYRVEQR
jgi:hypothetical protein